jgi:hypothetical protein
MSGSEISDSWFVVRGSFMRSWSKPSGFPLLVMEGRECAGDRGRRRSLGGLI